MFYGITAATNFKHIVRASLESVAYQIVAYLEYIQKNEKINIPKIIIDGGMTNNRFLMQLISNLSQKEISIPLFPDMSSYGSLLMGLIGSGKCKNLDELEQYRVESRSFFPTKDERSMNDFKTWKVIIAVSYTHLTLPTIYSV